MASFADDAFDVRLLGADLAEDRASLGRRQVAEHLPCVVADGNAFGADHEARVPDVARQDRSTALRSPAKGESAGTASTSSFAMKLTGSSTSPSAWSASGEAGVGGGEDVDRRALADLRGQVVGPRERELLLGTVSSPYASNASVSDEAAETVSSEFLVVIVAPAAGERDPQAPPATSEPSPHSPITMTEVALTIAVAFDAGLEAELLDRVPRDRGGDAVRPALDLDDTHDAVDLDRADDAREAVARRELVIRRDAARAARRAGGPR